jgi:hypothetical protein
VEGGAGQGKGADRDRDRPAGGARRDRRAPRVERGARSAAFEGYRLDLPRAPRGAPPTGLEATFRAGEPSGEVHDRRVVLEEMRKLAASAGRRLVVIDNLDLADPATIDLSEYLARNLIGVDRAPFVLVLTRQTRARAPAIRSRRSSTEARRASPRAASRSDRSPCRRSRSSSSPSCRTSRACRPARRTIAGRRERKPLRHHGR